jgi:hypothetical protein
MSLLDFCDAPADIIIIPFSEANCLEELASVQII